MELIELLIRMSLPSLVRMFLGRIYCHNNIFPSCYTLLGFEPRTSRRDSDCINHQAAARENEFFGIFPFLLIDE